MSLTELGIMVAIVVGLLALATWIGALQIALRDPSRSELEDRLRAKSGRDSEHVPNAEWLFSRRLRLVSEVAIVRVVATVAVVLVLIGVEGDVWQVVVAAAIAIASLWFATSVLADPLASHLGPSLIVRGMVVLRAIDAILSPIGRFGVLVDEAIRRLSGANLKEEEAEDRLRRSIEDTTLDGGLDESAAEMLENVVEFNSTEVGTVMTPRTDIEGLPLSDDISAIREFIVEVGHSRIPVFGENLDDIRGILYVKDLVPYLGTEVDDFTLTRVLRQPIRVPETKPVKDLLRDFQRSEVHLAIVVDEYGGTSGLVTIEDVLEEIVGEIQDEHDSEEEHPPVAEEVESGRWILDARYQIYDLNELLDTTLPEDDDFDTVAGFVLERLGRVPEVDESFEVAGLRFRVLDATPTRIERLQIERLATDAVPNRPEEGLLDADGAAQT